MNKERFKGQWDQIKGKVKTKWGKLTDDDVMAVEGKSEVLVGKLKEKYGFAKEKAEEELDSFMEECNCGDKAKTSKQGTSSTARSV